MYRIIKIGLCLSLLLLLPLSRATPSEGLKSPLEFLKGQEIKHRDAKGEVYLGKVMTLTYPEYGVDAAERYHPLLLELTDILKTPLRKNYRLLLKGYAESRWAEETNMRHSLQRVENLKTLLIEEYFMKEERITTEAHGSADPVASNETAEGRRLNRRVEVHVYGDVSEAVRFQGRMEERR